MSYSLYLENGSAYIIFYCEFYILVFYIIDGWTDRWHRDDGWIERWVD